MKFADRHTFTHNERKDLPSSNVKSTVHVNKRVKSRSSKQQHCSYTILNKIIKTRFARSSNKTYTVLDLGFYRWLRSATMMLTHDATMEGSRRGAWDKKDQRVRLYHKIKDKTHLCLQTYTTHMIALSSINKPIIPVVIDHQIHCFVTILFLL